MARWYNRRLSGYENGNPREGYNNRVRGYMSLGYTRSLAQIQARADMIERGEVRRNSRADERNRNREPRMTRSQRYLAERGNGESRAYSREVALAMYGERGRRLERRGITTGNINPTNNNTTQGQPTQGGGSKGQRSGAGSGG